MLDIIHASDVDPLPVCIAQPSMMNFESGGGVDVEHSGRDLKTERRCGE